MMGSKNSLEILDLTPDIGVNKIYKHAMVSEIEEQGFNVQRTNVTPPSIKTSIYSIRFHNVLGFGYSVTCDLIRGILILCSLVIHLGRERDVFISKCLEIKYRGLVVGDCIMSAFFRKPQTPIFPSKSLSTLVFILASILVIGYQTRYLRKACDRSDHLDVVFFNFETTGFQEVWRRFLISQNILELRFSIFHQGLHLFDGFTGVALRKGSFFRQELYDNLSDSDIQQGELILEKLVSRQLKYVYLKSLDVNPASKIEVMPFENKSTVILFLSTISDAQYSYGKGPYSDLHGFQNGIITAALNSGYNVVVKPHPAMFKDKDFTIKDRNYFKWLKQVWKVSPYCGGLMQSKVNGRLFFADSRISTNELVRVFPGFLCVTQHGTVAAESAFNGLLSLVGSNSKYFDGDKFVRILQKKSDILERFAEWQSFTGLSESEKVALYKFSFINNVKCRPTYANRLFSDIMPTNLDSWQVENWLTSYLSSDRDEKMELLRNSCKKFFRDQGINLKHPLSSLE